MSERILVVDDDDLHRALVRSALEGMGLVLEAPDAEVALRVLKESPVDLVVLDVVMPGATGFELCRKIKELTGDKVPVLLATALRDREHRVAGLSAGADDFLSKPLDRAELRLRVDLFLRLRRQEKQIRQQLVELQRLDALKDDLVSVLVHDLKHPLSGVFAWLSLARDSAPAETAADLDLALADAGRVRDAVNDLLQIRALEQGQLRPSCGPEPLDALVAAAADSLRGAARERQLTLQVSAPSDSAELDATLVRHALENLIANAIKFAPAGSAVEITATVAEDQVHVAVLDRGPGVPDQHKAELFAKFRTLDPAAARARRGFGLGLYLVQLVAEAHGGSAGVHDRPGGGAAFELTLPRSGRPA